MTSPLPLCLLAGIEQANRDMTKSLNKSYSGVVFPILYSYLTLMLPATPREARYFILRIGLSPEWAGGTTRSDTRFGGG